MSYLLPMYSCILTIRFKIRKSDISINKTILFCCNAVTWVEYFYCLMLNINMLIHMKKGENYFGSIYSKGSEFE